MSQALATKGVISSLTEHRERSSTKPLWPKDTSTALPNRLLLALSLRSVEWITDRVLPEPLRQFRDVGSIDLVVRRTGLGVWQASLCDASWLVLGIIFFTTRSG